ncbi:MAG: hypothetical protein JNJ85_06545, partial [Candidatus Kapabacteria bacterium]|nr:hypothetical protein [Candidatus Kapabacteria bacterium]
MFWIFVNDILWSDGMNTTYKICSLHLFVVLFIILLSHNSVKAQTYHWQWEQPIVLQGKRLDTGQVINLTVKEKIGKNYIMLARRASQTSYPNPDSNFTKRCMAFYSSDGIQWQEAELSNHGMFAQNISFFPLDIIKHNEQSGTAIFSNNIFRTTDAGVHWNRVFSILDSTLHTIVLDVASAPSNPYLYVLSSYSTWESVISLDSGKSLRKLSIPQLVSDTSRLHYFFADDTTLICMRD